MSRILFLMTKVHKIGCNILGLLLMGVWVVMVLVGFQLVESGWRSVGSAFFITSIVAVTIIDFLWRYGSDPRDSLWRFVLPGSGGAMLFVPMWFYFPTTVPGCAIAIAIQAINET